MKSEAIRQGDIPGVQLRCRQALAWTPEEAWPFLNQAAKLERWLCRGATVEEARLEWSEPLDLDAGTTEVVTVLAAQAPRRLLASLSQPGWAAATRLEFELLTRPEGCELSVLQNGFEHLPLSQSLTVWETYRRRWRAALERLAGLA